jgi:hypothetical protein
MGEETVPDYRTMFDRDYLGAWDLTGREVTATISRVAGGELTGQGGRKSKKPLVYFEGKEKALACNKTNAKTIAALYGANTDGWVGKAITMYPTTTSMNGETVDCIRVKPAVPHQKASRPAAVGEREPGQDG